VGYKELRNEQFYILGNLPEEKHTILFMITSLSAVTENQGHTFVS
jgi:hypothetical protein